MPRRPVTVRNAAGEACVTSLAAAKQITGLSRARLHQLIRAGRLPIEGAQSRHYTLIPVRALRALVRARQRRALAARQIP